MTAQPAAEREPRPADPPSWSTRHDLALWWFAVGVDAAVILVGPPLVIFLSWLCGGV